MLRCSSNLLIVSNEYLIKPMINSYFNLCCIWLVLLWLVCLNTKCSSHFLVWNSNYVFFTSFTIYYITWDLVSVISRISYSKQGVCFVCSQKYIRVCHALKYIICNGILIISRALRLFLLSSCRNVIYSKFKVWSGAPGLAIGSCVTQKKHEILLNFTNVT